MPALKQIVPTKEWTTLPRLKSGPWDKEPDKAQWQYSPTIACMVHRGGGQAWCGYVGVTEGHPLFGMEYDEVETKYNLDVHGGLTFSALCDGDEEKGICHVATDENGKPIEAWWLGFDCAHYTDIRPNFADKYMLQHDEEMATKYPLAHHDEVYRDYAYVRAETERLAEQIDALDKNVTVKEK